jgi:hypothetical protein
MDRVVDVSLIAAGEEAFVAIGPAHHVGRCTCHPTNLDNLATSVTLALSVSS